MKPAYDNINLTYGVHEGGICKIEIAPMEWLSEKLTIDFATGTVHPPSLLEGKEWLVVTLTPDSYSYVSSPKIGKAGSYYETEIGGVANDIDKSILQVLQTLRYHQFVVKALDLKKRQRICGDIDTGMILQITDANTNENGGKLSVGISLRAEHEKINPAILVPCEGTENFTDAYLTVPDVSPPTSMAINFSGGNLTGTTQVEIINIPGFSSDIVLAQGIDFIDGDQAYWSIKIITATFKVRWRRVCRAGFYSAWQEKTFTNPFF